ncbi:MAG: KAP family NTPase [Verrucomicrobia bacterium]|nr:KAP family NTPase [Verrucomicrobiota bacterium]
MANFLRNEKTTGPLTLAVTGDWGSGKSSLMGLLKEGIEAKGFRPVWFNAWHHQQEEQLLAALLESIRQQAVPPWLSWAGCLFRARLIQERLRRQWVAMLLGAAAFAMLAAVVVNLGSDWQNWLGNLAASSWPVLAGKLAVLAGATAAAFKGWQGLKAFGVDPARLLASVTGKARLSDLGAQTSFRHRFAQEFRDVTTALHPRTMTIFVDDLDRCEPAQVMQVMQALNFLSSSGECFLIVGMEESAVTNCVAVSLKEQFDVRDGRTLDSEAKAQRRWDYARHWMEKLIQIRIPVPSPDDSQFKALLIGGPPPRSRTAWAGLWAEWRDRVQRIWERVRPLVVLGVATGVALASYFLVDSQLAGRADRQESAASRATPAGGAGSPSQGHGRLLRRRNRGRPPPLRVIPGARRLQSRRWRGGRARSS